MPKHTHTLTTAAKAAAAADRALLGAPRGGTRRRSATTCRLVPRLWPPQSPVESRIARISSRLAIAGRCCFEAAHPSLLGPPLPRFSARAFVALLRRSMGAIPWKADGNFDSEEVACGNGSVRGTCICAGYQHGDSETATRSRRRRRRRRRAASPAAPEGSRKKTWIDLSLPPLQSSSVQHPLWIRSFLQLDSAAAAAAAAAASRPASSHVGAAAPPPPAASDGPSSNAAGIGTSLCDC